MKLKIASWGVGIQSTTMIAMSALGELPPLDVAIFCDFGGERTLSHEMHAWYVRWLESHGIETVRLETGDLLRDGAAEHIHIPFWTEVAASVSRFPDGTEARHRSASAPLTRQCTQHYKISPMRRWARQRLGFDPSKAPAPPPRSVEQWIGISIDEYKRAADSRVKYIKHRYPLLDLGMTRVDCAAWLESHGLPVPPKSACIVCPYRRPTEWVELRDNEPESFARAVAFDEANRRNPLSSVTAERLYIYRNPMTARPEPLKDADLDMAAAWESERTKRVQLPLFL